MGGGAFGSHDDGFKHGWIIFHNIWDVSLPIDEVMFFMGVETTNQKFVQGSL
jgi:hypothetical protein